jgi:hypothetical protein
MQRQVALSTRRGWLSGVSVGFGRWQGWPRLTPLGVGLAHARLHTYVRTYLGANMEGALACEKKAGFDGHCQ